MIAASFLTKHLGVDWRVGEQFFMEHLIGGDPASNNGGWQWAASTGTDAQPWFRIFNPTLQAIRHDPDGAYVRRWVPELAGLSREAVDAPPLGAYLAPIGTIARPGRWPSPGTATHPGLANPGPGQAWLLCSRSVRV